MVKFSVYLNRHVFVMLYQIRPIKTLTDVLNFINLYQIRGLDKLGRSSAILYKGDNF